MDCELLAPAGDFATGLSAFEAGADAVYAGLKDFSARAFAANLDYAEVEKLLRFARRRGKKLYITFNTLVDNRDMPQAVEALGTLEDIGVDAVIIQDPGVASVCRRNFPGLQMHASTQMAVHNLEGINALAELGFRRTVLARELSLEDISYLAKRCGAMELETFIHGALCYSVSGLCLYSAMEKGRSGNRGKCAYCCRLPHKDASGRTRLPFSMRDLRLAEDVLKLAQAGVASLKIEGRMKSPLYVASAVTYYREILDGTPATLSPADLESVFSRKTTKLRFDGPGDEVIDPDSPLGHLGTPVGVVKRISTDRQGLKWLRFHTSRALEKHDGLQFEIPRRPPPNEKAAQWTFAGTAREKIGFGISKMRTAMSRSCVYEVPPDTDVEVLLPPDFEVAQGDTVYCSMSNALKRRFPAVPYRDSDDPGLLPLDVAITLSKDSVTANGVKVPASLSPAKDPSRTYDAVRKAFSRTGGTRFRLGSLSLDDKDSLYAPMSVLNEARRLLLEKAEEGRINERDARISSALASLDGCSDVACRDGVRRLKIRNGQKIPAGKWAEIIVSIASDVDVSVLPPPGPGVRLALPLWNETLSFNKLRTTVKRLIRAGYTAWECADFATLHMLKALGVSDLTADWSIEAFNSQAVSLLEQLGVKRFVMSPEPAAKETFDSRSCTAEFLVQQSTPLFISLSPPAFMPESDSLCVFERDGLYVTVRRVPRTARAFDGIDERVDLSWDCPGEGL